MGNCGGICGNNISNLKGDIIMDKLISDKESEKSVLSYDSQKVKFLQKHIKCFLKNKKQKKSGRETYKKSIKSQPLI